MSKASRSASVSEEAKGMTGHPFQNKLLAISAADRFRGPLKRAINPAGNIHEIIYSPGFVSGRVACLDRFFALRISSGLSL